MRILGIVILKSLSSWAAEQESGSLTGPCKPSNLFNPSH